MHQPCTAPCNSLMWQDGKVNSRYAIGGFFQKEETNEG